MELSDSQRIFRPLDATRLQLETASNLKTTPSPTVRRRVDAINEDYAAYTEIIQRKLISNHVATALHVLCESSRASNRLLNRIDP
jgi:hypothetical protein